jgi:alkanesulfonate monooxygenase SsuD/methylene tetrahydromethanopterin reductase-like flavin-dependent oxidoreductase (luciferase family)
MSGLGIVLSLTAIEDTVAAAKLAEQAGFESVWTSEFLDRSATVALAAVAIATDRVTVGTAIAYASGRTPLVLAAQARDLDALSDGRLILPLGGLDAVRAALETFAD